jgi:hypothetical protein
LSGADTALELMSREIKKKVRLYNYPGIGPEAEHVMITILIWTPYVAPYGIGAIAAFWVIDRVQAFF